MRERILLVEINLEISEMVAEQALQPLGYQVEVVQSAGEAIQGLARLSPDLILADMHLPGLSGKDLLVALTSQGAETPVIAISPAGSEAEILQAFRLGAVDYINWPAREAEIVSTVERALTQVRARREREDLAQQLKQANQELQQRVRELTTLFAIGKAVTSTTDLPDLMDKIVEGAVFVSQADCGWLLVRQDDGKAFYLGATRNMPAAVEKMRDQPWNDGLSSLVGLSGEPLSIHGEPLKRFKISQLGRSALVAPLKVKNEVMGLLTVVRKADREFSVDTQALLEVVADYACISLVNARLFRIMEERIRTLQQSADAAKTTMPDRADMPIDSIESKS